ncbi:uncharacterized protein LOC143183497 [Calliopsis andreniformis]|uniref:uncharacterized protein LOC143183497 n=1 Tax=Calliopsis andreniformis TaxID=337506 RepID=UPI003FCE3649
MHSLIYFRSCHCYPPHKTDIHERSPCRSHNDQKFKMPMVKKYLPMYQSLELIEELKRHDRMRLIREREARRHGTTSSPRSLDAVSTSSKTTRRRTDYTATRYSPTSSKEKRLPYQERQAYKNVLCELQRRIMHQKCGKKSDNNIPLMRLSKKADKTKQVKQLYPPQKRINKRTDMMQKFTNKIIGSLKPIPCKKYKCKSCKRNLMFRQMDKRYDYSFDPVLLSDVSPSCNCSKQTCKCGSSNYSTDEITDNEELRLFQIFTGNKIKGKLIYYGKKSVLDLYFNMFLKILYASHRLFRSHTISQSSTS